jgi:formamidopyrimidine-DNA glycosylase
MPELPDVEVFRRHVAATSLHQTIDRTSIEDQRVLKDVTPQTLQRRLKHAQFETTRRHGKYLLIELANAEPQGWLVLHFGMTGRPQYLTGERAPPEHTRILLEFAGGERLAYVSMRILGKVLLVRGPEELAERKQLGPDALLIGREEFLRRLGEHRGSLKSALMNQSLIAGIGNVYSDEILFQMRLHPSTKLAALNDKQRKDLYRVMQRVLKTAIRHHVAADELPSSYLLPHRDSDGKCPECGGNLEKFHVGGRHAVYCPNCQRKGD